MRIKYCANLTEATGYAEAARNLVAALVTSGADVSVQLLRMEDRETTLSPEMDAIIRPLIGRDNHPSVKIVHTNPSRFPLERENGLRNIGCTVWETDRLPAGWVWACNQMDEIWVPCEWNVKVFQSSGVSVPVRKVPHALDFSWTNQLGPLDLPELPRDAFVFYSLFQWSARKNPEGLIKAYLAEFTADDNVCLLLKTYLACHNAPEAADLAQRVRALKRDMGMEDEQIPPIALLVANLSSSEIRQLHLRGDCLVLPHRSEGWGLPLIEAMASTRPVIATGFGGNLEFMNHENSYLIRHQLAPVSGMPWFRPYRGDQCWAEPDLCHLRQLMRQVYSDRTDVQRRAMRAAQDVRKYSWDRIGKRMMALLAHEQPCAEVMR